MCICTYKDIVFFYVTGEIHTILKPVKREYTVLLTKTEVIPQMFFIYVLFDFLL